MQCKLYGARIGYALILHFQNTHAIRVETLNQSTKKTLNFASSTFTQHIQKGVMC